MSVALISSNSSYRLAAALTSRPDAEEVVNALNNAQAVFNANASGVYEPPPITAAHVSTTTDFGSLIVGDLVLHIPATAGNAQFGLVTVAGTLPFAAVVGDLYVILRSGSNLLPSAVTIPL